MLLDEHKNILKETPILFSINPEEYEELLETFEYSLEYFEAGEEIAREFNDIGILLSGNINIVKESIDGSTTVVEKVKVGEIFCEVLTCLTTDDSAYRIISQTESELILIPYKNLMSQTGHKHHFTLLANLMRTLARKNLLLDRKLEILSKRTLTDKILAYLAIQREITGNNTFIIPYSRVELSEYLCVDRSALSRELSNLMKAGLIKYKKNLFTIMTSYEDIDLDEFDDIDDDDDDELEEFNSIDNYTPKTTDLEEFNSLNKYDDNYEDNYETTIEEIDDSAIDDIITIDGISIDDIDINIDDISIDDILNEDTDILSDIKVKDEEMDTLLADEEIDQLLADEEIDTLLAEETPTIKAIQDDDDYFSQEYAKYNDIEIDDIDTMEVINEIMEDASNNQNNSNAFLKDTSVFDGKTSTNEFEDFDENEESAMDEELREKQAKVFAQFVNQAKVLATKKIEPDEYNENTVPKIAPPLLEVDEELPVQEYVDETPVQEYVEELPVQEYEEELPVQEYVEELPVEEYVEELPVQEYVEELPVQEYDDEPQTPFEQYQQETDEPVENQENIAPQPQVMPAGTQVKEFVLGEMETFSEDFTQEFNQQQMQQQMEEPAQTPYDVQPQQMEEPAQTPYDELPQQMEEPAQTPYDELPQQMEEPAQSPYDEQPQQMEEPAQTSYDEQPQQVEEPAQSPYDEQPQQVEEPAQTPYDEQPQQVEEPVDDRDANLLLEPIDTLVEKITDELAPKSIEEAIEKLKDELLPFFARDPKDVDDENLTTPYQTDSITEDTDSSTIDSIDEPVEPDTHTGKKTNIIKTSVDEIVEDIAETLAKGKTKKQAKSRGFNLFNKFKRE